MRCYFMRGGHIVAVELLEAESDEHAIELGKAKFQERSNEKFDGVEIWDKARPLYRYPPDDF